MRWLLRQQPQPTRLHVARRTITRSPGDASELHEAVSLAQFGQLRRAGAFALHWDANGLSYGIRREALLPLDSNASVLVNGSRAALYEARRGYPALLVVQITADLKLLRQRLLARGRETPEVIKSRPSRSALLPVVNVDAVIRDEGTLEQAGMHLIALLGA